MTKELDALKRLYRHIDTDDLLGDDYYINDNASKDFGTIETALKRLEQLEEEKQSFDKAIEKKLKASVVIKRKRVNINELFESIDLQDYNNYLIDDCRYNEDNLTQEEYDFLKEVLV